MQYLFRVSLVYDEKIILLTGSDIVYSKCVVVGVASGQVLLPVDVNRLVLLVEEGDEKLIALVDGGHCSNVRDVES